MKDLGLTGHDVEKWLRESCQIEVELSDLYNILCIFTPGDRKEDADALIKGLTEIAQQAASSAENRRKPEVLLPHLLQGGTPSPFRHLSLC